MTARFADEKELKLLLDHNYQSFPTEVGGFYAPNDTKFKRETVTLGFEHFLGRTNITMDGIEVIDQR